jgi:hypothetical protein
MASTVDGHRCLGHVFRLAAATVTALGAAALLTTAVFSAPEQASAGTAPVAERIGEDRYRVGKLTVDLRERSVTCPGRINMPLGMVEYLAVGVGGKQHESVLVLDTRPLHLQVALILLGLEHKGGLRFQGDSQAPAGSPLSISVTWQRAGKRVQVAAEDLVWDVERKRPMERGAWVFSGWPDQKGGDLDDDLSLVATYRDPAAIVNNALAGGSDDTRYKVNQRIAPPRDSLVTVVFKPRGSVPAAGPPPPVLR